MRGVAACLGALAILWTARATPIDDLLERCAVIEAEAAIALLDSLFAAEPTLRDGTHPRSANAWHQRATNLYLIAGSTGEVQRALETALDIARDRPTPDEPLSALEYEYGYVLLERNESSGAAKALSRAIAALRAEGDDPPTRLWWQSDLAETRRRLGEISTAEALLREAVQESRELLDANDDALVLHAILLNNLGALYWDQNRLLHAERLYREALDISERIARLPLEGEFVETASRRLVTAHLNLGVLLRDQEKLASARDMHQTATTLARERLAPGDAARIYAEAEFGNSLDRLGAFEAADRSWQSALEGMRGDEASQATFLVELQTVRARSLLERGDLQMAEAAVLEATVLADANLDRLHPIRGFLLATRARVVAASDPEDARAIAGACEAALERLEGGDAWPSARAETLVLRGHALHALGRPDEAIASMEAAWEVVEWLRPERGTSDVARHRFMRQFAGDAATLVGWYVGQGDPVRAIGTAERFRSRLFQDELRLDQVDLRRGIAPDLLEQFEEREATLRARIASAQRELREGAADAPTAAGALDGAAQELRDLEEEIRLASPRWLRAIREADAASPTGIHGPTLYFVAEDDAAFVFYLAADGAVVEAHTLSATRDAIDLRQEPVRPMLLSLLDESVRGVVGLRPAGSNEPHGPAELELRLAAKLHELFRALIPDSLWQQLRDLEELTIVPDGELFSLPFEALVVEAPSSSEIRYWLDDGPALRYAPALRAISSPPAPPERQPSRTVLSISEPDFGRASIPSLRGRELSTLPGTARERGALEEAFGGLPATFLHGASATEHRVRAEIAEARFLHIATHGLVDRGIDSRFAALALTPGESNSLDDDGLLQLFEIYDLDLKCELAVLSACDTRSGERLEGEAAHALSRGFHVAGAEQVIASLWPVDDASTGVLMGALFGDLAARVRGGEPIDAARSLRDAKLILRNDARWSHPAYWAPFLLSGRRGPSGGPGEESP